MKTITELNNKAWYRLLKVVFIISFLITQSIGISLNYETSFLMEANLGENDEVLSDCNYTDFNIEDSKCWKKTYSELEVALLYVITCIAIFVIFKLIVKTFYYIVLGCFSPLK